MPHPLLPAPPQVSSLSAKLRQLSSHTWAVPHLFPLRLCLAAYFTLGCHSASLLPWASSGCPWNAHVDHVTPKQETVWVSTSQLGRTATFGIRHLDLDPKMLWSVVPPENVSPLFFFFLLLLLIVGIQWDLTSSELVKYSLSERRKRSAPHASWGVPPGGSLSHD